MMKAYLAVPIGAVLMLCQAQAYAAPSAETHLDNPSVRLWYEESGRLSGNIATPKGFALWNVVIGGGDAEENANDALFTVDLKSRGEQNVTLPLTLTAIDSKGKILARRVFSHLLTGANGNVTVPLWVNNIGCAGTVTFTARYSGERKAVSLGFNCGE